MTRLGAIDLIRLRISARSETNPLTGRVPAIRSTVDVEKATRTSGNGATEGKAVWTDPGFDARLHPFYYARAPVIPTPRRTLIHAAKAGLSAPDVVPDTVQRSGEIPGRAPS